MITGRYRVWVRDDRAVEWFPKNDEHTYQEATLVITGREHREAPADTTTEALRSLYIGSDRASDGTMPDWKMGSSQVQ